MYIGNDNKHYNLIEKLLLERCPELDLNKVEKFILVECKHDLSLYISYLLENNMTLDKMFIEYFAEFVLNYDIGVDHIIQPIFSAEKEKQFDIDCEKYARLLIGEWWNKFQVRTQVKLNKPKEDKEAMAKKTEFKPVFNDHELLELTYYISMILLKNGERTFIRTIARNLISGVTTMKVSKNKTNFTNQDKFQLMQTIAFYAKETAKKSGPLLYFFPDKNYYEVKMREWRSDNHGQIL